MRTLTQRREFVAVAVSVVMVACAGRIVVMAADAAIDAAYQRQFQALEAGDVEGHLKLAYWCRDQEAYDLLLKQCNHILSLDPDHTQAKLLLKLAKSKVPGRDVDAAGASAPGPGSASPAVPGARFELLSSNQVQILRRMELKVDRPERIKVTFHNDVVERFWRYMAALEQLGEPARVTFNTMSPPDKARLILGKLRAYERASTKENPFIDTFSKDIEITTDPMVFDAYKRRVWPVILKGCASSQCHSGSDAQGFSLFTERVMTDEMHYTNFMILLEYEKDDVRMIDRDQPQESLILLYGQPTGPDQLAVHPAVITPLFRTPSDRDYLTIVNWIAALEVPAPDYGFGLTRVK